MKSAACLQDAILDPKMAFVDDPTQTALNVAFNTKQPIWEWFEAEENGYRRARFGFAMEGATQATSPLAILEGNIAIHLCMGRLLI